MAQDSKVFLIMGLDVLFLHLGRCFLRLQHPWLSP